MPDNGVMKVSEYVKERRQRRRRGREIRGEKRIQKRILLDFLKRNRDLAYTEDELRRRGFETASLHERPCEFCGDWLIPRIKAHHKNKERYYGYQPWIIGFLRNNYIYP